MVRAVIFDFDLTLSAKHVFESLAKDSSPAAISEIGQLALIAELDRRHMHTGGFAAEVMGGISRVAALRTMLTVLSGCDIDCLVCTQGLVGPVSKVLSQAGLLMYFSGVYGNTGDIYGQTVFDMAAQVESSDIDLLGKRDAQIKSKKDFIQKYMRDHGFLHHDVLFVDDTIDEINPLKGVCQTFHVTSQGMDQRSRLTVLQMASAKDEVPQDEEDDRLDELQTCLMGWFSSCGSEMKNDTDHHIHNNRTFKHDCSL